MSDAINPAHYKDGYSNGAEVIDIVENLTYNRGAAVKYLARAGKKAIADELEDLNKAKWYVEREIDRVLETRGHRVIETTATLKHIVGPQRVLDPRETLQGAMRGR